MKPRISSACARPAYRRNERSAFRLNRARANGRKLRRAKCRVPPISPIGPVGARVGFGATAEIPRSPTYGQVSADFRRSILASDRVPMTCFCAYDSLLNFARDTRNPNNRPRPSRGGKTKLVDTVNPAKTAMIVVILSMSTAHVMPVADMAARVATGRSSGEFPSRAA